MWALVFTLKIGDAGAIHDTGGRFESTAQCAQQLREIKASLRAEAAVLQVMD